MKAYIHPAVNPLYAGFYIQALEKMLGRTNIVYSSLPFTGLSSDWQEVQMLFILEDDHGVRTKYVIDANDPHSVKPGIYGWCDVYGHCNANMEHTDPQFQSKLIPLCPSFGIRFVNNPLSLSLLAISNASLVRPSSLRRFLGKYRRSWSTCVPIDRYVYSRPRENYAFSCNTLWYSDKWNRNDETLNLTRARFIRVCKKIEGLLFEGGLVSQGADRSSEQLFRDCLFHAVSKEEWLQKTQQSTFVFNTPAFWGCHGWKLGEYLALGKCIISTPLLNDLPHPLEHGVNIHLVENTEESMREAIQYILAHPDYREHLENGALTYWQRYGSQPATLSLLLKH